MQNGLTRKIKEKSVWNDFKWNQITDYSVTLLVKIDFTEILQSCFSWKSVIIILLSSIR